MAVLPACLLRSGLPRGAGRSRAPLAGGSLTQADHRLPCPVPRSRRPALVSRSIPSHAQIKTARATPAGCDRPRRARRACVRGWRPPDHAGQKARRSDGWRPPTKLDKHAEVGWQPIANRGRRAGEVGGAFRRRRGYAKPSLRWRMKPFGSQSWVQIGLKGSTPSATASRPLKAARNSLQPCRTWWPS